MAKLHALTFRQEALYGKTVTSVVVFLVFDLGAGPVSGKQRGNSARAITGTHARPLSVAALEYSLSSGGTPGNQVLDRLLHRDRDGVRAQISGCHNQRYRTSRSYAGG
jgi:hypothetical protein